jgi:hypothetical protein
MSTQHPTAFGTDTEAVNHSLRESHKLLCRLFDPTDCIELRAIKGKKVRHIYCTTDSYPEHHRQLCKLNDEGLNIYFGVLPRAAAGGTTGEDVLPGRVLCIDRDKASPEELLAAIEEAGLPKPHATTNSGGGGQGFWVCSEPIELEQWVALHRGIIAAVKGADASIDKKPQLMRLPGFRNRKEKYGPAFPLACIFNFEEEGEVDATDFPKGVVCSGDPDAPPAIKVPDGYLSERARAFLERGELYPAKGGGEPSRRQTAFAVACEARASNIPHEEITARIIDRLAELGLGDEELEDVERQIANAYAKERSPNVDAADLPKVVLPEGKPRLKLHSSGGKLAVTVRYRDKSYTDTIDCSKAELRRRLLRQAGKQLGEGADLAELGEQLEKIAAGDIVPEPAPATAADLAQAEEVEGSLIVRPERCFIVGDAEELSLITVPVRLRSTEGIATAWRSYIRRGENREAIALPGSLEVDGITYYVSPEPAPPGKAMLEGWSKQARYQWLASGADVMPPAELLLGLVDAFSHFIEVPEEAADGTYRLLALFTMLSYNSPAFTAVPYLSVNGPAGSGKSRVLDCLKHVVFRPLLVSSTTAAAVFRQLNSRGGCLLFDEAEQLNSAEAGSVGELYPCLLAGYKRDGVASRCDGEDNEPREFSVYGPKVLTSIRELPETLASRCINLIMSRCRRDSEKALRSPDDAKHGPMWQRLRDALHAHAINRGGQMLRLPAAEAVVPVGMFPRSREIWAPLLQLAQLFEQEGAAGLLGLMQEFAVSKAEVAEQLLVPDLDAAILKAAAYLNRADADKPPTAGEIAARAQVADTGTASNITAKMAGSILRRYGLAPRPLGGRSIYELPAKQVREIEDRYGIRLGQIDEKNDTPIPLTMPPKPPMPPQEQMAEESGGGLGGLGGFPRGVPPAKNHEKAKVRPGKVVL